MPSRQINEFSKKRKQKKIKLVARPEKRQIPLVQSTLVRQVFLKRDWQKFHDVTDRGSFSQIPEERRRSKNTSDNRKGTGNQSSKEKCKVM